MEWILALGGCGLTGVATYWMGIRSERGRHARWAAIQEVEKLDRRRRGGVVLRRIRVAR